MLSVTLAIIIASAAAASNEVYSECAPDSFKAFSVPSILGKSHPGSSYHFTGVSLKLQPSYPTDLRKVYPWARLETPCSIAYTLLLKAASHPYARAFVWGGEQWAVPRELGGAPSAWVAVASSVGSVGGKVTR
jgi:hypothetical protein